jgi:hypothetical protein
VKLLYEVAARRWLPSSSSSRDHIGGDDADYENVLRRWFIVFAAVETAAYNDGLIMNLLLMKSPSG